MFRGMGKIGFRTTGSKQILYTPRANTFSLSVQNTQQEAKAWAVDDCGPAQTVDKVTTDREWSLKVGFESFDKLDISFMMDEQIALSPAATFPEIRAGVVPANSTLANEDLAANQRIALSVTDYNATIRLLQQVPNTTGTLTAGQFKVNAGSIVLSSADANKPVAYIYDKQYEDVETIGVESNYSSWGDVCFTGLACGPRFPKPMQIFCPSITRTGDFDLTIQDKATVELEFTPKVVLPYRLPVLVKLS